MMSRAQRLQYRSFRIAAGSVAVLLICAASGCAVHSTESGSSSANSNNGSVRVDPTVEMALTIAALTGIGLDNERYDPINRDSEYYRTIKARFAEWQSHAAITDLGNNYNLPRLVGNAADYELARGGALTLKEGHGSLWNDERGDLFRRHISAIENFADVTAYFEFFETNADNYLELTAAAESLLNVEAMVVWLEKNFSERPGRPTIYISRLLQGHHWASAEFQSDLRIWVNAYAKEEVDSFSPLQKLIFAGSVFTELDHPYVNPATEKHRAEIEIALADHSHWALDRAWKSYPTEVSVFNEYLTHAAYLLYLRSKLDDQEFGEIRENRIRKMIEGRGFLQYGRFVDALFFLVETHGLPVEELIPEMIGWSRESSGSPQ